ncbi:hypothetical protein [Gillisia mitskevichiae]|uniref:hypothetical protein n=1 Tax=Gillisia mitskevichiae TaxID=270921 RepID=UPI000EB4F2B9|nr:hypothetical protein [Gillisia mitskevichiae]
MKFISITFNDKSQVENFLLKKAFNFEHLVSAENFLKESLKNKNYPKNIILDENGCIAYVNYGLPYTKDSETEEMIQLPYTFFRKPINKILGD